MEEIKQEKRKLNSQTESQVGRDPTPPPIPNGEKGNWVWKAAKTATDVARKSPEKAIQGTTGNLDFFAWVGSYASLWYAAKLYYSDRYSQEIFYILIGVTVIGALMSRNLAPGRLTMLFKRKADVIIESKVDAIEEKLDTVLGKKNSGIIEIKQSIRETNNPTANYRK